MKCIIVDDEPIARLGMKRLADGRPDLEVLACLESAGEAGTFLEVHPEVDLVFLDIQMPGISGIEFARHIPARTLVVFTTAYAEYALDSYEVEAVDYLMKPIDPQRFARAVDKAAAYLRLLAAAPGPAEARTAADCIIVKADRRYVRLDPAQIRYVEGLKDYVIVHLEGRRVVTRIKIKDLTDLLPAGMFLRVSRSYVVNRRFVEAFDNRDVVVAGTEIAIGATYREAVLASLLG